MTGGRELFDALLSDSIAPLLKRHGFYRRRLLFWKRSKEGDWGVIQFQKSMKSSRDRTIFAINLGVGLRTVLEFEGRALEAPPSMDHCQWSTRIGFLLPEHDDRWWTLSDSSDLERVAAEVASALTEVALPAIMRTMSESFLVELWMRGEGSGRTRIDRLRALSVLLKKLDRKKDLDQVISELRSSSEGRPTEGAVRLHLTKLSSWGGQ